MKNIECKVLWGNIIIPICLGAGIYYLISPDVIFVKQIDYFIGCSFHVSITNVNPAIIRFIRNYLLDMLWGYALVFTVFYLLGNKAAVLWNAFIISFLFSVVMEVLQITSIARGTFDLYDIMVELLAEIVAVFIIRKLLLRRKVL
jgi:hypothetical protein